MECRKYYEGIKCSFDETIFGRAMKRDMLAINKFEEDIEK